MKVVLKIPNRIAVSCPLIYIHVEIIVFLSLMVNSDTMYTLIANFSDPLRTFPAVLKCLMLESLPYSVLILLTWVMPTFIWTTHYFSACSFPQHSIVQWPLHPVHISYSSCGYCPHYHNTDILRICCFSINNLWSPSPILIAHSQFLPLHFYFDF